MKQRNPSRVVLLFGLAPLLVACEIALLDLGSNATAAVDPDASSEAGIEAPITAGLLVDDEPCSLTVDSHDFVVWPGYQFSATASCPTLGRVRIRVVSREDVAYPQSCDEQTTRMSVAVGTEADASSAEVDESQFMFDTRTSGGSCTITTGPTASYRDRPIRIEGTVVDELRRKHRVRYGSGPS